MNIFHFIRRHILIILFFCVYSSINAQDTINSISKDTTNIKINNNRFILVKMNLLSLIDYTPSIQFSYQYNVYKRIHIQHEAGYITHLMSPFWNGDSKMQGYRIKTQIKYYITPPDDDIDVFYIAGEVMYKRTNFINEETFNMYDFSYFQDIKYKKIKEVIALSVIVGFEPVLNKKKILFDFYGGFGYRHLSIFEDISPDMHIAGFNLFRRKEGNFNMPGLYFGFRIGYKFNSFFNTKLE